MIRPASVETLHLPDGRTLCARRWPGRGHHTLVLLHGLLDSSEGWTPLCEGIGCTRIAFDLPGFGYSDAPSQGSIDGYATDIAEGLAQLGVKRFTIVGHSLGGAVAAALADMFPDRVAALVLLAPAGFGRIHLAEAVSIPGLRNLVQVGLPIALSSRLAVTAGYVAMVSNGAKPDSGLVNRVTERGAALVDGAREGTRAVVEAGRSRDGFHRRRVAYRGPVFAVWGDRDRLVPTSHSKGVRMAFPHAHIQLWPGMGHHPIRERFDDLVALIGRAVAAGRPQTAAPALAEIAVA
jgi:pimeloyl-ACP methyl ester carboxylesterase